MKSKKLFAFFALLAMTFFISAGTYALDLVMEGTIGNHPVTIGLTLKNEKVVTGYYKFTGKNAPQSGKILLSGSSRHNPPADMPFFPWYEAVLTAKTAAGKVCGKWNIGFETRTGTLEGTCTINGKKYEVSAEEAY